MQDIHTHGTQDGINFSTCWKHICSKAREKTFLHLSIIHFILLHTHTLTFDQPQKKYEENIKTSWWIFSAFTKKNKEIKCKISQQLFRDISKYSNAFKCIIKKNNEKNNINTSLSNEIYLYLNKNSINKSIGETKMHLRSN